MAPLAGQAIHQRQGADHHVCDGRRLVESLMQFRYLRALYPRERQAAQGWEYLISTGRRWAIAWRRRERSSPSAGIRSPARGLTRPMRERLLADEGEFAHGGGQSRPMSEGLFRPMSEGLFRPMSEGLFRWKNEELPGRSDGRFWARRKFTSCV